jgi:hypothetical protein
MGFVHFVNSVENFVTFVFFVVGQLLIFVPRSLSRMKLMRWRKYAS